MERKDLIVKAKELGFTKAHTMKTVELEAIIASATQEKKSFVGIKTGRKPNPESARQKRLAELQAKMEAGVTIKKGRPVVEGSMRQLRLKELEERRASGELRRGRPAKSKIENDNISLIDMLKKHS